MSAANYVGRTLARYKVVERLGAGGMGEVFRAFDGVLQRPVALKILPHEVVADDERLRRFVREAQSASALNHPNIVTIYDVGECSIESISHPVHYIAMELIEGKTLGGRIYGGCSLRTLIDVVQQVADALSRAHAAGIFHRDLKPDNIMVTNDGRAKVVDFGLAKVVYNEPIGGDSATARLEHTREGIVMGTVGYMSPEQVNALPIDGRSDIFALGCVLFEAVTKRRPFAGTNTIDTLHLIVNAPHEDPTEIDPALPPSLDRIVGRCLAKDPDERYQSMKEVAVELRLLSRELQAPAITTAKMTVSRRRRPSAWPLVALAAALAIASLMAFLAFSRDVEPDLSSFRFTPLQTMPQYEGSPSYSPDGRTIAYVAEVNGVLQVFVRSLDAMSGVQLTHSIADCRNPFWDPNGREIDYTSVAGDRDALWTVGVAGGGSRVLLENVSTAAVSPDGKTIAFLRSQGGMADSPLQLWLASPRSAAPHLFADASFAKRTFLAGWLRFSTDGKSLGAWLTVNATGLPREFWLIDVGASKSKRVLDSLSDTPNPFPFVWMPDSRRIVFSGTRGIDQNGGVHLWMADTKTGRLRALTASSGSEVSPTVSPDGKTIVFGQEDLDFDLVKIPVAKPQIEMLLSSARAERDPAWSPAGDGFSYVTNRSGNDEIWFRSIRGDFERPIATSKDFDDHAPTAIIIGCTFSPDGQRIAYFRRGRQARLWVSPAGGGPALTMGPEIITSDAYSGAPTWSPDASSLAFVNNVSGQAKLEKLALAPNANPVILLDNLRYGETHWSPDGRWLTAHRADGFYLVAPDGSAKKRVSDTRWLVHAWSRDSKAIYGLRIDDDLHLILSRLSIDGTEQVVADLGVSPPSTVPVDGFNLSPDGQTFLAGFLKPKGDLWMLQGFENEFPWWRRLFERK
jgi:eukaryotic-like serine/threonine-protein kinase